MPKLTLLERIQNKIVIDDVTGCWTWTACRDKAGYGRITVDGRLESVHRVSYLIAHGELPPAGFDLDHLCRNRACANPDHLEPVSHRENVLRGCGGAAVNARKTHCIRGHEFTPENTRFEKRKTHSVRKCRTCERARNAQFKANARQARAQAA